MNTAGLFAGIGGFELGLQQAGHHAQLLCDVLPTAQAVLRARFPAVEYHHDLTTLADLPASVELLCAGFPCQDLSQAGRGAGLLGARSGLIAEVFRLLARRRVDTVLLENVPFMLQLGGGNAMRAIVDALEQQGYRWAYRVVDSWSFGLAQRRERVFLVASRVLDPAEVLLADEQPIERPATSLATLPHGFYWTEGLGGLGWAVDAVPTLKNGSSVGIASPPAVLLPDGRLLRLGIRSGEQLQGFEADWTLPAQAAGRPAARWGLVGSAVSVPVARWIGQRLAQPGRYDPARDQPFPVTGRAPRAARFDGRRRQAVQIGPDPLGRRPAGLLTVLAADPDAEPLSLRATRGFLSRTRRARLRFAPGFIAAVEQHLLRMGGSLADLGEGAPP
ncbi:MAG: DNA cytosine methyltransferase [Burkholderiaceae bacterium]|nr:DNA cytosine methyltransferase [Burkholderiaceae bacterium]